MSLTVVTTCHKDGLVEYGHRFIRSFAALWPSDIRLLIYAEGWLEELPRAEVLDLLAASAWLPDFKHRHRDNPQAHGVQGARGYRWGWDAVRFSHKVAAVIAADKIVGSDHLLWLDADVFTHEPVRHEDIAGWLPGDAWLTWLNRTTSSAPYPECGFLLFNRRHERHGEALDAMRALYAEDRLFQLDQTHDSFVWKYLVDSLALPTRNLSGAGERTMHPMVNGPLGKWFDHLKGPQRKAAGRTDRRDLRNKRTEAYWQ